MFVPDPYGLQAQAVGSPPGTREVIYILQFDDLEKAQERFEDFDDFDDLPMSVLWLSARR